MSQRFKPGDRVHSPRFGTGEILEVDGYGEKERLTIQFESAGRREVLSSQFVLEPFDNELHSEPLGDQSPPTASIPQQVRPVPERPGRSVGGEMQGSDAAVSGEIVQALREVLGELKRIV